MLSKIFKAYDIRGTYPDHVNEEAAWQIGCAAGRWMKAQLPGRLTDDPMSNTIVIGRDMRKSSPSLTKALVDGLRHSPMNVIDLGMVDTSFIYFAINFLGTGGGIMVTASHNPPNYNGFKLSGLLASPIGGETGLVDIQRIAAQLDMDREKRDATTLGHVDQRDLWADYREHILRNLELKRKLKVFIDASNGMGGVLVPKVFEGIKNLEIVGIHYETNGEFVHEPNPLVPENMKWTQEGVKKHKADIGVCFDGDADRCMLTDEQGNLLGCDLQGAVMAGQYLKQHPGAGIVYDLRASKSLPEEVERLGGKPILSKVGHVNMKAALREHDAVFGAELSGHFYFRDSYYTDSGAITFAVIATILAAQEKPLSALIKAVDRYAHSGENNFKVEDKDKAIADLKKKFGKAGTVSELDGVSIDAWASEGWWFNIRASNTEPLLRLNLEGKDEATRDKILSQVMKMLGEPVKGH